MKDLDDILVRHQREKGSKIDPHGKGVDNDRLFEARHLRDAKPGVIGAFAQELGVDRDEGMPRQARAGVREFLGRRDRLHGGLNSAERPFCQGRRKVLGTGVDAAESGGHTVARTDPPVSEFAH